MINDPKITNQLRDAVEAESTSKSRKHKYLSEDELIDVLTVARDTSARDWAMLCVTYWHGCRNQEVAKLRLDHIDQANNMLTVHRDKSSQTTRQPITEAKGTPVLNELAALKAWMVERKRLNSVSDFVFLSTRDGSCLGQRQVNRIFAGYCEAASKARVARGEKPIDSAAWHIHSLKRTRGTLLGEKGVGIYDIKLILGHKSVRSCEVYVNPTERGAWERAAKAETDHQARNSWGI